MLAPYPFYSILALCQWAAVLAAPLATPATEGGSTTAPRPHETVPPAPDFPNPPLWSQFQQGDPPQPVRGDGAGAPALGSQFIRLVVHHAVGLLTYFSNRATERPSGL